MIINYNNLEIIPFKNYEINHNQNINNLILLEKIWTDTQKLNLPFIVTGSIGFILKYNKIYRTIGDIDLLINLENLNDWKLYFIKNLNFSEKWIRELAQLENLYGIHRYESLKDKNLSVDLIIDHNIKNYETICIGNYKLNYTLPKYSNAKYFFNRSEDYDDLDFFNKFIKKV
jgi:hypothetical protein